MMRCILWLVGVVVWLVAISSALFAYPERVEELWRSRYGMLGQPSDHSLAVDSSDGTLWVVEGAMVTHSAASGELLARSPSLCGPGVLTVNPEDHTCWVSQHLQNALVHLSTTDEILSTTPGIEGVRTMLLSPSDDSVWVQGYRYLNEGEFEYYLAHVSATGSVLLDETGPQGVIVDPADGTIWKLYRHDAICEVARVDAAGEEAWRVSFPTSYYPAMMAEDIRDQSVWIVDPAGTTTHLSATGGAMWQENTDTRLVDTVFVSPPDGSVWISYYSLGDVVAPPPPEVVHRATSGAELSRVTGRLLAVNEIDGSVWVRLYDTGDFIQYAADGSELRRFHPLDSPYPPVYSLLDNSFWGFARVNFEPGARDYLLHVAQDGTILYQSEAPRQQFSLLGPTLNPSDGSLWVGEWVDSAVLLSSEGVEQERREFYAGGLQGPYVIISPFDGTWWVSQLSSTVPLVYHVAPNGTELASHPNCTFWPVVNPADGSVWGQWTQVDFNTETQQYIYQATLSRISSADEVLWTRPYDCRLSDPVIEADGSAWVIAFYDTGAKREHISAAGEYLGDLPLTPEMLPDYEATPMIDVYQWTREADRIYALFAIYGPEGNGGPSDGGVRCFDANGMQLWETAGFRDPQYLIFNLTDRSLWVSSWGAWSPPYNEGSSVGHLAADGTVLWQGDEFNGPWQLVLDPRDGSVWVGDLLNYQIVHLGIVPNPFTDVTGDNWAFDAIAACKDAGIVTGFNDNTYRPGLTVKRSHMAAYLARALCGGDTDVPEGPATPSFPDVAADHWAYQYIEYCKAQNIVEGYADGYHPDTEVKRDQMAVFVGRAFAPFDQRPDISSFTPPTTSSFTDVSVESWAFTYIEYCKANGIVQGYGNEYRPGEVVKRDQMAVYIARAFRLL